MSAKWRRSKKNSKRFNIFRIFSKTKTKDPPQTLRIKRRKANRQAHPYKYRVKNFYVERKLKERAPLIDVLEEQDEITIVTEFAGFKRENLKILVRNQRLTLSAEASDRKYHKSLNLPKRVIPSTIRTTYKNGVLEIRLKKASGEKAIDKVAG